MKSEITLTQNDIAEVLKLQFSGTLGEPKIRFGIDEADPNGEKTVYAVLVTEGNLVMQTANDEEG